MQQDAFLEFGALDEAVGLERVSAVCLGTGRFLRTVLVPALVELGGEVVLAQTRGSSFGAYMRGRPDRTYEIDTVHPDGQTLTANIRIAAVGSLGQPAGRKAFLGLPPRLPQLRIVGLGLTEAGIVHNGTSIVDLAEFLHACFLADARRKLSVLNTDNMPFNGDAVRNHVLSCNFTQDAAQSEAFQAWLQTSVCFHNTMVDGITSHRAGVPEVPLAEPLPAKALVIEDLCSALPPQLASVRGVVVRTQSQQLGVDLALKLRIANGTHTAMVYAMALGRVFRTDGCIGHPAILPYLEQLFERDIVHVCSELSLSRMQVAPVFGEWMSRLQHPHFGLSCFFVCQNASQKLGIRLLPSVKAALRAGKEPSPFMAFAIAVMLRFLTPIGEQRRLHEQPPVFLGRLEPGEGAAAQEEAWEYTPGLSVRPSDGTYEFKDGDGIVPMLLRPLGSEGGCTAAASGSLTAEVLSRLDGFDPRGRPEHRRLAAAVGELLRRMLSGEPALKVLASLHPNQPLHLEESEIEDAVRQEVEAAEAVDVHTHLFPAGGGHYGEYGIDAMLTYHYLVSQYLAVSEESPEAFYELPQAEQAERIWKALFLEASPVSEHCRGVLTTLHALGLREELAARDLAAIRRWYAGQDAHMFNEKMMRLARLRYVITSHDPFEPRETPECLAPPPSPPGYRPALAADKLLEGTGWDEVLRALSASREACTLRGLAAFLERCIAAMKPVLVTAATADSFCYGSPGDCAEPALDAPLDAARPPAAWQLLDAVLLPLCERHGLPLSLRMGTRRAVAPSLRLGGDSTGRAHLDSLARLCDSHKRIKFMFTVLDRRDQHEAAVLAGKFRNLHLWGCWWYCNNPTIVADVTALRLEMVGTNFTFQASSARVHDQLIYKWIHARALLTRILAEKYRELAATGWRVSRGDVRRDVQRLLGGAFEEFASKPL